MHEVVVTAVRAAVSAATIILASMSKILFLSISLMFIGYSLLVIEMRASAIRHQPSYIALVVRNTSVVVTAAVVVTASGWGITTVASTVAASVGAATVFVLVTLVLRVFHLALVS